jgi:hypothetical protein
MRCALGRPVQNNSSCSNYITPHVKANNKLRLSEQLRLNGNMTGTVESKKKKEMNQWGWSKARSSSARQSVARVGHRAVMGATRKWRTRVGSHAVE